jgi:hypothetical protein
MLYADGAVGLVVLVLWVYTLFDVITSDPATIRNLPKVGWFVVVLLLGELAIGPVLWFLAGRPVTGASRSLPYKGNTGIPPEYDRPGRAAAQSPDDDAAFLAGLKDRADEQRTKAAEQARRIREAEDEAPPPTS